MDFVDRAMDFTVTLVRNQPYRCTSLTESTTVLFVRCGTYPYRAFTGLLTRYGTHRYRDFAVVPRTKTRLPSLVLATALIATATSVHSHLGDNGLGELFGVCLPLEIAGSHHALFVDSEDRLINSISGLPLSDVTEQQHRAL
jgi:hypothetical protein